MTQVGVKVGREMWAEETGFWYECNRRGEDSVRVCCVDVWEALRIAVFGLNWECLSAIMD